MTGRISVVIPAYNASRFLAEALASVVVQTHAPEEVIVVDDGSDDSPGEIVAAFPLVRLITLSRSGVSVARNTGVAASTGEYIAFLDADDTWAPAKLERQIETAAEHPDAGIVMARQSYRFESGIPAWFRGPVDGGSEAGYMPSNWLIRRATWDQVGGFKPGMTHSEDTDWLARASDLGVRVVMVDEPLVVHRIHDRNASGLAAEVKAGMFRALRESVQRKQRVGLDSGGSPGAENG